MKLYQTVDGTMIGFYQETGGEVQAVLYRDIYEVQLVTKTREEQITEPGLFKIEVTTVQGYWIEEEQVIPGRWEREMAWFDAYDVTRYREVPGHYETRMVDVEGHYEVEPYWFDEYSITRYRTIPGYWETYEVTRPADPVTGRTEVTYTDSRWIDEYVEPYEEIIPAGYQDTRVWIEEHEEEEQYWVDTYTEEYIETIPAGEKETRVWYDDEVVFENVWVPEKTTSKQVWIEPVTSYQTVEYQVLEEVWVGRDPVYEYVDESQVRLFEVVSLNEAAGPGPEFEDVITIRNKMTGEELDTTAKYVGLATRIGDNEYVVPP